MKKTTTGSVMLTALSSHRTHCYAWVTEKNEAPFFCKECLKEVILRKGSVRIHHFAHKSPVTCQYGLGETDVHHKAKKGIFEALKTNPNCSYCELEKKINNAIPDVYAVIKKVPVAIEIQRSNITVQDVCDRTLAHHKNGLSVIWVIPSIDQLKIFREDNQDVSRVPKWLECLHALAYGRVYVWSGNGEAIIPIHFDRFTRYVPSKEFYNSYGEYVEVGGYDRTLKDRKIVLPAPELVSIGTDFCSLSHLA
ncbi:MAG: competence protein CoiA [Desulfovibrio sp.]|uniref:competence protein CoiA n=1 Tax=Desulfovibrio sp. TaxID=885 RepID=UPI00135E2FEB|nr:competence protein CoiA family protein [Desulfovibrio sp.]MTJ91569.1 competence protein CoiA [Desulfovibrio sp.]